jgi:hypothetical protein
MMVTIGVTKHKNTREECVAERVRYEIVILGDRSIGKNIAQRNSNNHVDHIYLYPTMVN